MEKIIRIDSLNMQDIISRIHYNEEDILNIIEGLAEGISTLSHYNEDSQCIKAISDAQKILCELLRIQN